MGRSVLDFGMRFWVNPYQPNRNETPASNEEGNEIWIIRKFRYYSTKLAEPTTERNKSVNRRKGCEIHETKFVDRTSRNGATESHFIT